MPIIPNRSVVCHAEGMFSKGPEGVKVNPNCPFLARQALPEGKTFQEMRRWILDTFQLDEATHDITLRYIVRVLRSPSTRRRYDMLFDILRDDEWRTFMDVTQHLGGSFVLYAQRRAKQQVAPGAVPGGAIAGNYGAATLASGAARVAAAEEPAVTEGRDWPLCKHGQPCTIQTHWGPHTPGHRFFRCRLFADAGKDCGFTQWLDEEFPEQATKHINSLLSNVGCLEQQVQNLQEELDELRRRYGTGQQPPLPSQQP